MAADLQDPVRPVVASYCTTFLKREMLHIYRQVTGLRRYGTFVMTKSREHAEKFPFSAVEVLPRPRINFLRRFYKKYLLRMEPVFYRGEYDQLNAVLARRSADVLHVYFGHTGVHLLPFLRHWPGPSLVSFHGMDIMERDHEPGYNASLRALLRFLPMVLARSESLADRLAALGCDRTKIRINRTGIPLGDFPSSVRQPPANGCWRVIQACRFIEKKGLADTLEAFAAFHGLHARARLVLAGEGPLKASLQKLATALGVAQAVEFPGFLNGRALQEEYHKAHIFIHPSRTTPQGDQEGVPNAMLEAMASGLPIVATRHGGIPEAVVPETEGLLTPENDPASLAAALGTLADEPGRLETMSQAAASGVRSRFDIVRSIARLEDFYDEVRRMRPASTATA